MITSVIYAKEDRYLATIYMTNFFIQIPIDKKPRHEKIIMKIKVVLVDMLIQMYP